MEEINQIETQSRAKTVNPSMCLKEKTNKPSIKPINGDVLSVICSEVKAAEDEHLGKDETVAAFRGGIQQARHRSEQNPHLREGCRGQSKSCKDIRGLICF